MNSDQVGYHQVSDRPMITWVDPAFVDLRLVVESYSPVFLEVVRKIRSCQFPVMDLGSLVRSGYRVVYANTEFVDPRNYSGIPVRFVQAANVVDGFPAIDFDQVGFVPGDYWERYPRGRICPRELLIEVKGQIKKVAVVSDDPPMRTLISGSLYKVTPRPSVDVHYLASFVMSDSFQSAKDRLRSNSVISYLNKDDLYGLPVVLPPRPVQVYIGDKVRLAERCHMRARELWEASTELLSETLGMPLSTEYFDKIDLDELQSESYRLKSIEPVAAWIQADIVDHELGPQYFHPRRANVILKLRSSGAELARLTDLAVRRNDRASASRLSRIPYYVGLADINSTIGYFDPVSPQEAGITGTSALFRSGDILFSKLRPYLNKVSICPDYIEQACGSTELLIYRVYKGVLPYYVFFVLKSNVVLYQVIDVTSGSTLPRVDPDVIDDILVPMVPLERQQAIDLNTRQVFSLLHQATQFIDEAKADVEALIEGHLDVEGILNGQVKTPTWEDIAV